jgi:HPr kinase/phosphorylase
MPAAVTTPDADVDRPLILHASAVALGGLALVITGPSGSGKSQLALALMALGAALVADDRTMILPDPDGPPRAAAPDTIRGLIEARGLGLLAAEPAPPTPVTALLDLGRIETERLPPIRHTTLAGSRIPLLHKVEMVHFPAALLQYLKGGVSAR